MIGTHELTGAEREVYDGLADAHKASFLSFSKTQRKQFVKSRLSNARMLAKVGLETKAVYEKWNGITSVPDFDEDVYFKENDGDRATDTHVETERKAWKEMERKLADAEHRAVFAERKLRMLQPA